MESIAAFKLFGFAISAAVQFSLLTFVWRRPRLEKLEVLFSALITCLLLWNFGHFLLLLFAQTTEATAPLTRVLLALVVAPVAFGSLAFLPPLLMHTHLVFQPRIVPKPIVPVNWVLETALYAPLVFLPWALVDFLENYDSAFPILTASDFSKPYAAWFSFALLVSGFFEWKMFQNSLKREDRVLFATLLVLFVVVAGLVLYTYYGPAEVELEPGGVLEAVLMLWSVVPSALLGYFIFRHNFLEIAIQRSFGYPFAAVLLLLVYLVSVRYVRDYVLVYRIPDAVVQAGMILVLLPLLQPLKRWIDILIDRLFTRELSKFENLAARLDGISRSTTDLSQLLRLTEQMLVRELSAKTVQLILHPDSNEGSGHVAPGEHMPLAKGQALVGEIRVENQTGKLTSEQQAALRFVAPHIVGAIEACRLVEGKIQLERELGERDRLAAVGQMAATVAHNIKNPLSSIKTIVQLMREDEGLMTKYSEDLALINSEVDRLSQSVTDLLGFSKPTAPAVASVDLAEVLDRVILIFRPEAERHGIRVDLEVAARPLWVRGNEAVLSEVFQNLVVNALEVSKALSRVALRADIVVGAERRRVCVQVDDEGPGIPSEIQQKIFTPFFTTKQKGTGLGLAVVQRRVMDLSGEVTCISPISARGGARFEVRLPEAKTPKAAASLPGRSG